MKGTVRLLLTVLGLQVSFADVGPYTGMMLLSNKVASAVVSQPGTPLNLLERVAEARFDTITTESELQIGLKPGDLHDNKSLNVPSVRAYAYKKIGETGLSEALDYLERLKASDLRDDDSG